jgi:hypothetical protein
MQIQAYKPKSNITSSVSIPQYLEDDYLKMRRMLKSAGMGQGEYNVLCFNELHKGCEDMFSARSMRLSK